jgi:hypothetical protein
MNLHSSYQPRLILLALLVTGLNSIKPLHIDDGAYYYYAAQIAAHPLDPYGFQILWYDFWQPANRVLAPPVLPAWWGLGLRLFGDHPVAWKLWLLPFALLLVFAVYSLAHRFARGLEMPLVTMTILSSAFLPGFNLMLDLPALALSLSSLVLFFRFADGHSWSGAMAAGLLAGVAMETKYTSFLAPVTMVLYSFVTGLLTPGQSWGRCCGKCGIGMMAAVSACAVFAAWEAFIHYQYGESHFLSELRQRQLQEGAPLAFQEMLLQQFHLWSVPLLMVLGGAAPQLLLLALAALRRGWVVLALAASGIVLGYVAIAGMETTWTMDLTPSRTLFGQGPSWFFSGTLAELVFGGMGALTALMVIAVLWQLVRVARGGLWRPQYWRRRRVDWFLFLWLVLEVVGCLTMTPFGAVRRALGVVVVGTMVFGRLAALRYHASQFRKRIQVIAYASAILGLGFWALDWHEADVRKQAAERAAAWIREQDPKTTIWYVGHWGFQYYAEHAGMRPLSVEAENQLRPGHWLVIPDARQNQQSLTVEASRLEPEVELFWIDPIPLRTVQCYYGTATGVPLEHHEGPRIRVAIYKILGP